MSAVVTVYESGVDFPGRFKAAPLLKERLSRSSSFTRGVRWLVPPGPEDRS